MRYATIKRCHECGRLYDGTECPECGYYAQDYAEPENFDKDDDKEEEDDDETVQHI